MSRLSGRQFFYGWVVLTVSFICMGVVFGVWYSFTVFFLDIMKEFDLSRGSTSLVFTAFVIVVGSSGPLVGILIRRFRARRVMPIGALLMVAGLTMMSVIQQAWQLYLAFCLLTALGLSLVGFVPNYSVLSHWFVKQRGLVFGIVSASLGAVSIVIMVPLCEYLVRTVGWRGGYLTLAAIIAIIVPGLIWLLLRDCPEDMGLRPDNAHVTASDQVVGSRGVVERREMSGPTAKEALHTWRFWAVALAMMLMPLSSQSFLVHAAPYMVDLGRSPAFAAFVVGMVGLISVPSKIGWGFVFDRVGVEGGFTVGAICMALSMSLLILLPVLSGVWGIYVATVLFSLGYSANAVTQPTVAAHLYSGEHYGTIYGCINLGSNIGAAIGPLLAGYVFDLWGSYAPAFLIAAVAPFCSCALIWVIAPRQARMAGLVPSKTEHYSDLHKY